MMYAGFIGASFVDQNPISDAEDLKMRPTLAVDDVGNSLSADRKAGRDCFQAQSTASHRADGPDVVVGQFCDALVFTSGCFFTAYLIGVNVVVGLRHPFEIRDVIVAFIPVLVVAVMARRSWSDKGRRDQGVNFPDFYFSESAQMDRGIALDVAGLKNSFTNHSSRMVTPHAACHSSDLAVVADVVKAFISCDRFPAFHVRNYMQVAA